MPTVGTYGAPRVQESALPNARVSVNAPLFGEDTTTGTAIRNLDKNTQIFAQNAIDEANDAAIKEAYVQAVKRKNHLTYDPNEGFSNLKGKSAIEAIGDFNDKYNEDLDKVAEGLKNPVQQQTFSRVKARLQADFDEGLQRHGAAEFEKYSEEQYKSSLETITDDAVLNYQTPGKVGKALEEQRALITDRAMKSGHAPDSPFVKDQIIQTASKTHTGVIARILSNGNDQLAREYFADAKAEMTKEDLIQVEKAVKEGSVRGESQRSATDIMSRFGSNMGKALAEAREIHKNNPEVQEATVREVKVRFAENEQAKEQGQRVLFENAFNSIMQTRALPDANVMTRLSPEQKNAAISFVERMRKGVEAETDVPLYHDLMLMSAMKETQKEFLKHDLLLDYMNGKLKRDDFDRLLTIKKNLVEGNGKSDNDLDGFRTATQIVNQTLSSAGIDTSPQAGSEDAALVKEFNVRVNEEVVKLQKQNNKKATDAEIQQIADGLIQKGRVPGSGFFGSNFWAEEKRAFQLKSGEKLQIEYDDIPRAEIRKIERSLRSLRIPVDEASVLEMYLKGLERLNANQ